MNAEEFNKLVKQVRVGKHLPDSIYLHKDAFNAIPPLLVKFVHIVAKALKVSVDDWNIVKLSKSDFRLSLLNYLDFYIESYPVLKQSITVDLAKLEHRATRYNDNENPPILHRKELLIMPDHPDYQAFCLITQEGEAAGLYDNSRMIGFKASWLRLIAKHGYELVDGRLFRCSAVVDIENHPNIDRHKTALARHELSAPMKTLAKYGFLNGEYSVFDYGCGRGDDLRELEAHGLDVSGWDPNFRPDAEKTPSDVVNIGFVINVIEDRVERLDALIGSWDLTQKLLVVSAMLANENFIAQFKPYKDGVITSRNTFQKYYSQSELKEFIESSLDENAIAISPGIFYVFRDKNLEQEFQLNRQKRNYQWRQLTTPELISEVQARLLFTQHETLFEAFWKCCLNLGRMPAEDEFHQYQQITELTGSPKKALRLVCKWYNQDELEQAASMRKEDLLVYFALAQFQKHKGYAHQPMGLKRDIKVFFGDYRVALTQAKELLFSIADPQDIEAACLQLHQLIPSKLDLENDTPHSITFHKSHLNHLNPLLRIYTGAALQLYGELDDIDLIKIHLHSGKLTLLGYDDFSKTTPLLAERVKIKMAQQSVDFFDYVDTVNRPPLLDKQLYFA